MDDLSQQALKGHRSIIGGSTTGMQCKSSNSAYIILSTENAVLYKDARQKRGGGIYLDQTLGVFRWYVSPCVNHAGFGWRSIARLVMIGRWRNGFFFVLLSVFHLTQDRTGTRLHPSPVHELPRNTSVITSCHLNPYGTFRPYRLRSEVH